MSARDYHCVVAIGHFGRRLREGQSERTRRTQPLMLLSLLWLHAKSPHEAEPQVAIPHARLDMLTSRGNLRNLVSELKRAGALKRIGTLGGYDHYRLLKPDPGELDAEARAELELDPAGGSAPKRTDAAREAAQERREQRQATLKRLGKKPSDVRDVLAAMAGKKASNMRYSGRGAGPVVAAVEWIVEQRATWAEFVRVCQRVLDDPNKPPDVEWVFGTLHREYLTNLVERPQAPEPAATADEAEPPQSGADAPLSTWDPERVREWFGLQVSDDDQADAVWSDETTREQLLQLSGAEVSRRIKSWRQAPQSSLGNQFTAQG